MKEMKQRRKKERTWAEAARLVLENYSDGPMTPKQILQVIEAEGLKEMSGTSPLACLNAMLHSNSRSCDGLFYKLPGRISLFTLKKDAVQWSRNLSAPEGEELDDTADAESSGSNEAASTVSGDNDVSLDETSSNASCSTEPQGKSVSAVRESHRAASQASKQKKKTGVMLPRVVLTPLKVNGAHMETSSGFTGRQAGGESSSGSSSTLCSSTVRGRTEITREPPQLFRGFRKPSSGQMKRNRGDDIDFETPGSILVNTNLRALINSRTFNALPLPFQQQLLLLLPEVDRQAGTDGLMRLSGSALNNEFFTHAAQSWRERLADGEFTHEMQVRIRQEMEKEKKTEQWKERFFEDYYGQKLGLAREEPQQQNSTPGDTEDKTASASCKEPARTHRGPVTRQRDGHFKKHSLRCRTRRSLYKLRESEQAEAAKEPLPAEAESTDCRDTEPEVDVCEGSRASLKSETPPEATRLLSKAEDVMSVAAAAAAADRIPSLPQEPQDQEPKEQKRKCSEQAASASFPEKKPRLEDRQSFRNTIESVHPEKPQPTKEEPKVPPIRIQLSRIKPPWVVKGQPTYQICPRIIPNTEPSGQDRTAAPTSADFKACALQGRTQREAAAPAATAAIGGGGGPGGGGRCTDEGGGGGGGRRRRIRQPSNRPKRWRSKRTRGKRMPSVQRAQLLPPPHLEEEAGSELAKASLPAWVRTEACTPALEGSVAFEQAACRTSVVAEDAIQLAESSGGSRLGGTGPELPLGGTATETLVGSSGHLRSGLSREPSPALASQGSHDKKEGRELPPSNPPSRSLLEPCPVDLLGEPRRAEGPEGVILNCISAVKETTSSSHSTLDLPPESNEQERFAVSGSEAQEPPGRSRTVGTEGLTQRFHVSPQQLTTQWHGRERPGDEDEASPSSKPVPMSDGLNASHGSSVPKSLPPWERLLGTRAETAGQQAEAVPRTNPSSDDETRSVESETTETASEAELTEENVQLNQDSLKAAQEGAAPSRDHLEKYNGIRSECSERTGARTRREGLPSEAGVTGLCPPQRWGLQPSLLPKACETALRADLESQKRPLLSSPKPLPVAACNPLVVQLPKGGLPLKMALPRSSHSGAKVVAASSPNRPSAEHSFTIGSQSCLSQKSPRDEGIDVSGTVRNGYCVPVSLRDSPKRQCAPDPVPMPVKRLEGGLQGPEQGLPLASTSNSPGQAVSTSREPDASCLRGGAFSSHDSVDQKAAAAAAPAEPVAGGSPEKQLHAVTGPRLPPSRTSLGPDQLSAESVPKSHGVRGKKVFGSGFAARAQHSGVLEHFSMVGMLSHSKLLPPPPKGAPSGAGVQPTRDDCPLKPRAHGGGGSGAGAENKHVPASPGPAKRHVEKRKEASASLAQLTERLQGIPLVRGLPFFKLPREPGRGPAQPLEPSSIPSQLNIKQAFYGKLSKLQLNPASLNHASNAPVFPRSLAGSMMPLGHKVNFATSRGVSLSAQMFADSSTMEEIALKCSCSLKAMIMCKGCGAFCHDDCIGPSKLCVLCLVVR